MWQSTIFVNSCRPTRLACLVTKRQLVTILSTVYSTSWMLAWSSGCQDSQGYQSCYLSPKTHANKSACAERGVRLLHIRFLHMHDSVACCLPPALDPAATRSMRIRFAMHQAIHAALLRTASKGHDPLHWQTALTDRTAKVHLHTANFTACSFL